MKKFISRLLIFSIAILGISVLLNQWVYPGMRLVPYTWGSDLIHKKRVYLVENKEKFNTLFIGSSRIYRQIIPRVFDDSTAGMGIKSFNFGVNWLFAPESFYLLDQLEKSDKLKFRYVFIELSKIRSVDYHNLHTTRIKYWYNFTYFEFALKAVLFSNVSLLEKISTILVHTISYLDYLLNLGYMTEAFDFRSRNHPPLDYTELGKSRDGFYPYGESNTTEGEEGDPVNKRHENFLKDTTVLARRIKYSHTQFKKFRESPELLEKYNKYYTDEINRLIMDAQAKGTFLIFIVSPRIDYKQYNEIIPIYHKILPGHAIEISDASRYPQLYHAKYSNDETHLNTEGAAIYTGNLAREFKRVLSR
jgi:hypothetical protein